MMHANSAVNLITKPTRFPQGDQHGSPSLLDHFYTNQISKVKHIGLLINDTTDHLPIIATISMHTKVHKNQLSSHIRDFRNFNIDRFNDDLCKFNDDESENLDIRFQKFHSHLQSCVNSNLPLRKRTKKEIKFAHKPWISSGLKKSIYERNRLYRLSRVTHQNQAERKRK